MTVQSPDGPPPNHNEEENIAPVKSTPTNRVRWATHKASAQQGRKKRQSIMNRIHRRVPSDKSNNSIGTDSDQSQSADAGEDDQDAAGRTIYFNQSLPPEAKDEDGHPKAHYARNKIRTAKYTPLSFVPKNLWFQFHNVANIYFLFIVLLSVSSLGKVYQYQANKTHLDCVTFWRTEPRAQRDPSNCHCYNHGNQRCY